MHSWNIGCALVLTVQCLASAQQVGSPTEWGGNQLTEVIPQDVDKLTQDDQLPERYMNQVTEDNPLPEWNIEQVTEDNPPPAGDADQVFEVAQPLKWDDDPLAVSKESADCGTKKCLSCERIVWGIIANSRTCSQISQDETIHSVNDIFWAVSGNCKPQVTFEGEKLNVLTKSYDCHASIRLPRAHKKVDWGAVKGKSLPGQADYFHLENWETAGSCWCLLQSGRSCSW